MKIYINESEPFKALGRNMAISATTSGYVLEYSVDGVNWTSYETEIPANENLLATDLVQGIYLRLNGNTDQEVAVRF